VDVERHRREGDRCVVVREHVTPGGRGHGG
jgi:hypothetical protein